MDYNLGMINNWVWSERFWLPRGYTWKDLESNELRQKAELKDLRIIPILVIIISIARLLFEYFIAHPFCKYLGIGDDEKVRPNKFLENVYRNHTKFPTHKELMQYADKIGWTKKEIKSWFFIRRKKNTNAKMKKATETCWRALFYYFAFSYGGWVLFRSDWFWDNSQWIDGHITHHELTPEMKWYYFIEISFYMSLLMSQFIDTKRKDFVQMFIHHVATLVLLFGSYITSFYRIGAIIMFIHDAADGWLESAKLANYAKIQKVCDVLFAIFAIIFIITRLIYYPIWVGHGYFYYNNYHNAFFQQILVCLCFLIMFLSFYWGVLIVRMAYASIVLGKVDKDSRSDTEEDTDDETNDKRENSDISSKANHQK